MSVYHQQPAGKASILPSPFPRLEIYSIKIIKLNKPMDKDFKNIYIYNEGEPFHLYKRRNEEISNGDTIVLRGPRENILCLQTPLYLEFGPWWFVELDYTGYSDLDRVRTKQVFHRESESLALVTFAFIFPSVEVSFGFKFHFEGEMQPQIRITKGQITASDLGHGPYHPSDDDLSSDDDDDDLRQERTSDDDICQRVLRSFNSKKDYLVGFDNAINLYRPIIAHYRTLPLRVKVDLTFSLVDSGKQVHWDSHFNFREFGSVLCGRFNRHVFPMDIVVPGLSLEVRLDWFARDGYFYPSTLPLLQEDSDSESNPGDFLFNSDHCYSDSGTDSDSDSNPGDSSDGDESEKDPGSNTSQTEVSIGKET